MNSTAFSRHRAKIIQAVREVQPATFTDTALQLFRFQAEYNPLYREYLNLLTIDPQRVDDFTALPFLPIQFFKSHQIKTGNWQEKMIFTSSGTTAGTTARHYVYEPNFYLQNCKLNWSENFGNVKNYCVLALLPAYLEREGSSLIYMAEDFINASKYNQSGFFLYDVEKLSEKLKECRAKEIPTVLLGVSFALLDFAEKYSLDLSNVMITETGGMKGRRKEMTRSELHRILCKSFNVSKIYSEYGMTELFSQAYSHGNGIFRTSSTLRVYTREITDPLTPQKVGKTGAINIIDLANVDTCAFIATDDLGKVYADGSFEILGRTDASDVRGCNLLLTEIS